MKTRFQFITVILFAIIVVYICCKKDEPSDYPSHVVASIPVQKGPSHMVALPNGEYVYVANTGSNDVSVIRTSDNTVVTTIALGNYPFELVALPNSDYVYVANCNSDTVSVIGY